LLTAWNIGTPSYVVKTGFRIQEAGVQEFRSQEFRSSGVQEFRSSGVRSQESGVRMGDERMSYGLNRR
jgi:hypothetical protein